jgi:hypothetical protein
VGVVSVLTVWRAAGLIAALAWILVLGLVGRIVRVWDERRSAERDGHGP